MGTRLFVQQLVRVNIKGSINANVLAHCVTKSTNCAILMSRNNRKSRTWRQLDTTDWTFECPMISMKYPTKFKFLLKYIYLLFPKYLQQGTKKCISYVLVSIGHIPNRCVLRITLQCYSKQSHLIEVYIFGTATVCATAGWRYKVAFTHNDVIKWKYFPRYWPLCGEFTGHRWIPLTKASDAEIWCFLWSAPE